MLAHAPSSSPAPALALTRRHHHRQLARRPAAAGCWHGSLVSWRSSRCSPGPLRSPCSTCRSHPEQQRGVKRSRDAMEAGGDEVESGRGAGWLMDEAEMHTWVGKSEGMIKIDEQTGKCQYFCDRNRKVLEEFGIFTGQI